MTEILKSAEQPDHPPAFPPRYWTGTAIVAMVVMGPAFTLVYLLHDRWAELWNTAGLHQATSGQEALTKVGGGVTPVLVITDYHMPGMTGIELIAELRKKPACRFIPILMLTTESQQERRTEAKSAGATGWLVKPVPADKLVQLIKQVVPGA